MLQKFLFAWQPSTTIVTLVFMLVMLAIAEFMASQTRSGDFGDSFSGTASSKEHYHVFYSLSRYSVPSYWFWYQKEAVHEAIEAQGLAINSFILCIVFNAAMAAPALCVGLISLFMFFAVRVLDPLSRLNWLWCVPVVGMFFDVTEEILLLIITLGYPFKQYPTLMDCMRFASAIKFAAVVVSLISIIAAAGSYALKGKRRKDIAKIR